MDLNFIVFPAPKCSYTEDVINGQLIWIPKHEEKENQLQHGVTFSSTNNTTANNNQNNDNLEDEFSATKNKNFGSHQKPINYKKKRARYTNQQQRQFQESLNLEDTLYNDENSHRLFYSVSSSQRQLQNYSHAQTNNNLDQNIQNYSMNAIGQNFIKKVENQRSDKDYIQIMQKGQQFNSQKQVFEESNKSCHDVNSCILDVKKGDDYEEQCMQRDCNEYDEMHSNNISCNVKPDSITQYSFSKQPQKSPDSSSSSTSNSLLQNNNENLIRFANKQPLKKAQTIDPNVSRKNGMSFDESQASNYIPCLYLNSGNHSPNYVLYFHGNGEDINLSYDLLSHMKNNLEVNVIAMEYPEYGMYQDFDTSIDKSQLILKDAEYLYDYLTQVLHIDETKIIIFGRSIGSGPATHVAAHRNPGALVLMSAFTSLRQVASDLVGKFLSLALKDRFNNLENIKNVTCPTFLVHGQVDKLISYNHSMSLFQNCGGICQINLPKEMSHVEFDFYEDFSKPLIEFLLKNKFDLYNYSPRYDFNIPYFLFQNPKLKNKYSDDSQQPNSQRSFNQFQAQKIYYSQLKSGGE